MDAFRGMSDRFNSPLPNAAAKGRAFEVRGRVLSADGHIKETDYLPMAIAAAPFR